MSFSLVVSKFDSSRTASSVGIERFCASSMTSTGLRRCRCWAMRNSLSSNSRWAWLAPTDFTPQSCRMYSSRPSMSRAELCT